ncbi:MAG: MarR family transcriptional regulator, partial [Firmicutes bacterium]|nr:MarR family transcriptional regulator [Bacillota bacterium]
VMMYMWEKESSNVKDMGKALLLDSGTLTPLLKKLESKGFITRVRSKVDERNLDIEITKEGMALRDKALTVPEEMSKCVALTREEAETLCRLMRKVLAHIEAE